MQYKKDKEDGYDERLRVLGYHHQTYAIVSQTLEKYPRNIVSKDDILDALVAVLTGLGPLKSLPDPPEIDDRGLPMQMFYRAFGKE